MWNKHPVQNLNSLNKHRIQIPNPNPKGKKQTMGSRQVLLTGNIVPINQVEMDHKVGNHSLQSISDLQSFIEAIVFSRNDDDLNNLYLKMHIP